MMQTDIVLQKLDTARNALAEAKTIQETKRILDVAAAAEILAKRQKLGEEAVRYATSIKVEALAQLGRMLKEMPKNKGTRLIGGSEKYSGGSKVEPPEDIPTLADLLQKIKPTLLILITHNTPYNQEIDFAKALVKKYRYKGRWATPQNVPTTKELIDSFLKGK